MAKNIFDRSSYFKIIKSTKGFDFIEDIVFDEKTGKGSVTYDSAKVFVDPDAPDFSGYKTTLNDEEFVRILALKHLKERKYTFEPDIVEIERTYPAPGRPKKGVKGSRADIIIRDSTGNAYIYIELKTPSEYESKKHLIEGQLFQSSKLEKIRPQYLAWMTIEVDPVKKTWNPKVICIPTSDYSDYSDWKDAGMPCGNILPENYGKEIKKAYGKVAKETTSLVPLDESSDEEFFTSLIDDLHNVIWGGGGTSSNEVFAIITKLFLCKIYDEKEAKANDTYQFQIKYTGSKKESDEDLLDRLNKIYKEAETSYLATKQTQNAAFDSAKIPAYKIAYVVQKIENISLTKNSYGGDLLGRFFEEIVSHGFTQTKGQFFTPVPLVQFMLSLCGAVKQAKNILENCPDGRGIHRMPVVIDSSCGVGTFLIEYMKVVTKELNKDSYKRTLNDRTVEAFESAFAGPTHTNWAKTNLYAIENNYDLGLAAKVNMILHGDGSMNTHIKSGLLPFPSYQIAGRPSLLGVCSDDSRKLNEQYDLVLSNPPFSIKLTEDEKAHIKGSFSGSIGQTEDLFIERWYQLLKPEGMFCCVLPESVCDTKTEIKTRLFMLCHFQILAVISLPYSAFKPYTSVKTCVVLARRRENKLIRTIEKDFMKVSSGKQPTHSQIKDVLTKHGIDNEIVFYAEPLEIGYKRRKGLPDLETESDLDEVIKAYNSKRIKNRLRYGFRSSIADVMNRDSMRLDPKYRWLWDIEKGTVKIDDTTAK